MSGSTTDDKKSRDNKTLFIVIIAILVVIVMALAIVLAFFLGKKSSGGSNGTDGSVTESQEGRRDVINASSVSVVTDEESAATVMDSMREKVEEGMFSCKMSMNWTFKDGKSESKDAYVANKETNTHPIYFDVYLMDESETLIYSSPVLAVGSQLTDFKLDKELDAGTYKAKVLYSLIKDEESQEVISSAGFVITIEVEN